MKRLLLLLVLVGALLWGGSLIQDRQILNKELIRLHVVGESDSQEDQSVKLQVRDAVLTYLQSAMEQIPDVETAKEYIQENLPELEAVSNQVLASVGSTAKAAVSLAQEAFPTRDYDTFSLPAGIYESLRITIGEGEGKNWWCVVFPRLCVGATSMDMEDTAVGAGFSEQLTNTIARKPQTKVRFYFLDCLGRLENLLFRC